MTIHIIHDEKYFKYHSINSDDVIAHGMEKALILGNIDKAIHYQLQHNGVFDRDRLHESFPYIEKKKFYRYLSGLIKDKLLIETTENQQNTCQQPDD